MDVSSSRWVSGRSGWRRPSFCGNRDWNKYPAGAFPSASGSDCPHAAVVEALPQFSLRCSASSRSLDLHHEVTKDTKMHGRKMTPDLMTEQEHRRAGAVGRALAIRTGGLHPGAPIAGRPAVPDRTGRRTPRWGDRFVSRSDSGTARRFAAPVES